MGSFPVFTVPEIPIPDPAIFWRFVRGSYDVIARTMPVVLPSGTVFSSFVSTCQYSHQERNGGNPETDVAHRSFEICLSPDPAMKLI
jgi:hypothetical protein